MEALAYKSAYLVDTKRCRFSTLRSVFEACMGCWTLSFYTKYYELLIIPSSYMIEATMLFIGCQPQGKSRFTSQCWSSGWVCCDREQGKLPGCRKNYFART